jgi:hypothetical protein
MLIDRGGASRIARLAVHESIYDLVLARRLDISCNLRTGGDAHGEEQMIAKPTVTISHVEELLRMRLGSCGVRPRSRCHGPQRMAFARQRWPLM